MLASGTRIVAGARRAGRGASAIGTSSMLGALGRPGVWPGAVSRPAPIADNEWRNSWYRSRLSVVRREGKEATQNFLLAPGRSRRTRPRLVRLPGPGSSRRVDRLTLELDFFSLTIGIAAVDGIAGRLARSRSPAARSPALDPGACSGVGAADLWRAGVWLKQWKGRKSVSQVRGMISPSRRWGRCRQSLGCSDPDRSETGAWKLGH